MVTVTEQRRAGGTARVLGAVVLSAALPLTACGTTTPGGAPETVESTAADTAADSAAATGSATTGPEPAGRWSSPEAGTPFLELSPDGSASGSDGCNRIETTWELDGDTITFAPFTAAQQACAGVDPWLAGAASATIDGEVMTVRDGQGSVIGGLEKQ